MDCFDCKIPMPAKHLKAYTVHYCQNCFDYKIDRLECDHDYMPILFEIASGAEQIRLYCRKCCSISGQAKSKKDYDLTTIQRRNLEKYHEWYAKYIESDSEDLKKTIEVLKEQQQDLRMIPQGESMFDKAEIYSNYINSEAWKIGKRLPTLNRDNHSCRICGDKATEVHHLTYKHFQQEYDFELVSLCNTCHMTKYHPNKVAVLKDEKELYNLPDKI